MKPISQSLINLIKISPLSASALIRDSNQDILQNLKTGNQVILQNLSYDNLASLAALYAEDSTYNNGSYWRVWREIQLELNSPIKFAFDKLSFRNGMSYAHWALDNGYEQEAVEVYKYCLTMKDKEDYWSWKSSLRFLDYFLSTNEFEELIKIVDDFVIERSETPGQQIRAVKAEIALGKTNAALKRLDQACYRWHYSANLWATAALIAKELGHQLRADFALKECLKFPFSAEEIGLHKYYVPQSEYQNALKLAFHLSDQQLEELKQPFLWPNWDFDKQYELFRSSDGVFIRPSEDQTPHWFGGDDFKMPNCLCGLPKRQWFLLNISKIESLSKLLPNWNVFPLLGCAECAAWIGRHDYRVDPENMTITLDIVGIDYTWIAPIEDEPIPVIAKQYARLEDFPTFSSISEDEFEWPGHGKPKVGGMPDWIQSPMRVYCHCCRQEMVYVAGMESPSEFKPYISINNESGYQYHFACNNCLTISVIAQNT